MQVSGQKKKKIALYISDTASAATVKERCAPVEGALNIGLMKNFGNEPVASSFKEIQTLMMSGDIDWVIFHLPSVARAIGTDVFISAIKKLIRSKAVEKTKTYIIDPEASFNARGRASFEKFRVHVVDDESYIGDVFSNILALGELEVKHAAEEDPLFKGLVDAGPRLPGMMDSTPSSVSKRTSGPFDDLDSAFADAEHDPFVGIDLDDLADDPYDDMDNPFGDPFGSSSAAASPFGDPFGNNAGSAVSSLFGEPDPYDAWNDSAVSSTTSNPFGSGYSEIDESMFDDLSDSTGGDMGGYDDLGNQTEASPFGPVPGGYGNDGYSDDYDDLADYDNGYGEYDDLGGDTGGADMPGGMGIMTVSQLLDKYGYLLPYNEQQKLASMGEPGWDYILEHEDGIGGGKGGGILGGLTGKGGKSLKGLSQVASNELADSLYIAEKSSNGGYYTPPNDCKITTVYSAKGGTGKTTISVMVATQLNWYFNPELMQHMTTSINARVLLLSLNEFDDIPTHGIGYDEYFSEENDNDGRNIFILIQRINETGGEPSWDDISYCFVSTQANNVFYLPSLTQKEQVMGNIVIPASDYKKVIEVCSRFFQFIIMDSPDLFYNEKADLMNFAFSVSDIICFVIEPDIRSTTHLHHLFEAMRGDTGKMPLDPNKCICVVNKYVKDDNPYGPVPIGQLKFEKITTAMAKYFARFVAIPYTQPRGSGNILDGTDPKIKYAAAELADDILELIDYNDEIDERKRKRKQGK